MYYMLINMTNRFCRFFINFNGRYIKQNGVFMDNYKYKPVIKVVAIISIVAGLLVITGWTWGNELLITFFLGYSAMKFCTAVCLFFLGSALLLLFQNNKYTIFFQRLLAALVIFIGLVSFFGNVFNYDFVFNKQFTVYLNLKTPKNHFVGRMSYFTSFSFFLLGVAFFNLRSKKEWVKLTIQWALHITTLLSMIAMMGHLYGVSDFHQFPFLSTMGINAALGLLMLSVAASLVNPSYGITGLLSGDKTGNVMARRLFPMIAFLLLSITYVRLQVYRQSTLDMGFATILFTTCMLLINLLLIWRTALQLNKTDTKRKAAEESILLLNKNLEHKVEQRTDILKNTLQQLERSRQELNEALNKEKELNEIKSRFVSMASHEFKTPLSTILSSASLISRYEDKEDHANRDKHVQRIKNSVEHLNGLLEEFLSLGRLETGRLAIDCEPFDLQDFLHDIVEEIKVIRKPGQGLQLHESGATVFNTDRRLLKNILLNMLSNAIKFSSDRGNITLQVNNTGNELYISVKDDGIGISDEDKQYLFSTFFRGANVTNIQGTGLGLHIVKRYIDLLNGTIELQSELNKGTTISIMLPVFKEKEELVLH
jgi:signal transduction histidine kinase